MRRIAAAVALVLLAAAPAYADSAGGTAVTSSGGHCALDAFASRGTTLLLVPSVTYGYSVDCDVTIAAITARSELLRDGVVVESTAGWSCTACSFATERQSHLFAEEASSYRSVTTVTLEVAGLTTWSSVPLGCTVAFGGKTASCTFGTET